PTPPIPAPPVIVYAAPGDDGLDIWTTSAGTGLPINITNTRGISEGTPAWSPGGAKIAFVRYDGGGSGIWVMRADGTESDPLVESASKWLIDPTWSPDGTKIAFSQGTGNTWGIWVINVDSRRLYKVAEENNTRMLRPDWSPDGTKIVF